MSSTLLSTPFNSTSITVTKNETIDDYDYQGAAIYIAAILIWYSTGLVLMLFFHVRSRTFQTQFILDYETNNKSTPSTTNPFANYHNIQADNIKKQILGELKDPERRQRLWKIYYSSTEKQNEPHPRYYKTITADTVTIGRINRKLADIHRINSRSDDDLTLTSLIVSSNDRRNDTTKSFTKRLTSSRRLSTIPTNTQRPLYRVQSQPDTTAAVATEEVSSLICEKQPSISTTNGSRRRNNKLCNRFTVEKVPENNSNCSIVKENVSE
jgi:hypothetical protein